MLTGEILLDLTEQAITEDGDRAKQAGPLGLTKQLHRGP